MKKVDFQSWARSDDFVHYGRRAMVGLRAEDVKAVSIERLCLSPHVKKPLNSKVIKFRTWTNFAFSDILCLFHISVSWVCYHSSYVSIHTEEFWYNETVCMWMTIYTLPARGLSTLAWKFTATTRIMQSSSNDSRTLVSGKAKMLTNGSCYIKPYNSLAEVVRLLAEPYDTKWLSLR